MVSSLRFSETLQIGLFCLNRRPCSAVDSLKLLVALVSTPVGGGNPGESETLADHAAVWYVGASAKIKPGN